MRCKRQLMLCACLDRFQIPEEADLLELRLDLFATWSLQAVQAFIQRSPLPVLCTLRPVRQGGQWTGSEAARLDALRALATLQPAYLDVEWDVPRSFVLELGAAHPTLCVILSHHDLEQTPKHLDHLLHSMQRTPASMYKIACRAHSACDALRMLLFAQRAPHNVLTLSLGAQGSLTRILSPVTSRPFTYASTCEARSVHGQLSLSEMLHTYSHHSLTPQTALYGLIGHPIDQSPSHITHNALLRDQGAVYVKIDLQPEELGDFLLLARQIGFSGLSVTMPFKEAILAHLDALDPMAEAIGAVNTLVLREGRICGYNTDGAGALNTLEERGCIKDKRVTLLGAGGSARAIAFEAKRRGARLSIFNRTPCKATTLATQVQADQAGGLDALGREYDILINATCAPLPIPTDQILPGRIIMDITHSQTLTPLLREAKCRGCTLIGGYEMFLKQAQLQFALWHLSWHQLPFMPMLGIHLNSPEGTRSG